MQQRHPPSLSTLAPHSDQIGHPSLNLSKCMHKLSGLVSLTTLWHPMH